MKWYNFVFQAQKNKKSRKKCDDEFKTNQLNACKKKFNSGNWLKKLRHFPEWELCKKTAMFQYKTVRLVGSKFMSKKSPDWCSQPCAKSFQKMKL